VGTYYNITRTQEPSVGHRRVTGVKVFRNLRMPKWRFNIVNNATAVILLNNISNRTECFDNKIVFDITLFIDRVIRI